MSDVFVVFFYFHKDGCSVVDSTAKVCYPPGRVPGRAGGIVRGKILLQIIICIRKCCLQKCQAFLLCCWLVLSFFVDAVWAFPIHWCLGEAPKPCDSETVVAGFSYHSDNTWKLLFGMLIHSLHFVLEIISLPRRFLMRKNVSTEQLAI